MKPNLSNRFVRLNIQSPVWLQFQSFKKRYIRGSNSKVLIIMMQRIKRIEDRKFNKEMEELLKNDE